MSNEAPDHEEYRSRFLAGSAWMVLMRWATRLLGLMSTLVLARLLSPEDFGLVAMAMVAMGLLETFVEFGTESAILRDKRATQRHIDTAWTIRLLQKLAVAGLLLTAASTIAGFFDEARLREIVYVASLTVVVQGFENIGVVLFRKDLDFRRDALFNVYCKVVAVVTTIVLAIAFKSYWALVWGQVTAAVIRTVLSYTMSPYRPSPSLSRFKEIFGFSQWMLVSSIGHYVQHQGDRAVVGRVAGATDTGIITVAKEIGMMVSQEVTVPVTRALYPTLAQLVDEPERFARAFLLSAGGAMCIALPAAVGLVAVSHDFVALILGPQWSDVPYYLEIYCLFGVLQAFFALGINAMLVQGRARQVAALIWIQGAALIAAMVAGFRIDGLASAVAGLLVANALIVAFFIVIMTRIGLCDIRSLAGSLVRPVVAAGAMYALVKLTGSALPPDLALFARLLVEVLAGVVSYTALLLGVWWLAGRPDGLEDRGWAMAGRVLTRWRHGRAASGPLSE